MAKRRDGRHGPGERRPRRRTAAAERVAGEVAEAGAERAADHLADGEGHPERAGDEAAEVVDGADRVLRALPEGADDEVGGPRLQRRVPGARRAAGRGRLPSASSRTWARSTVSFAVDEREVGLLDQGDAAALEALDDVDLPQRPGAVEAAGQQLADELAELVRGAGPGQRRRATWKARSKSSSSTQTGAASRPGTETTRWR